MRVLKFLELPIILLGLLMPITGLDQFLLSSGLFPTLQPFVLSMLMLFVLWVYTFLRFGIEGQSSQVIQLYIVSALFLGGFTLLTFFRSASAYLPGSDLSNGGRLAFLPILDLAVIFLVMPIVLLSGYRKYKRSIFVFFWTVSFVPLIIDTIFKGVFSDFGRAGGFYSNSNAAAATVLLLLVCAIDWQKPRLFDLLLIATSSLAIVFSASRASMLFLALLVPTYLLSTLSKEHMSLAGLVKTSAFLSIIALSGMVFLNITGALTIQTETHAASERYESVISILSGDVEHLTTDPRILAVEYNFREILKEPFTGHGTGYAGTFDDFRWGAHNIYIHVWEENGVVALTTYLLFLVSLFSLAWKHKNIGLGTFAILVVYLGLFSHNLLDQRSMLIPLALMMTSSSVEFHEKKKNRQGLKPGF